MAVPNLNLQFMLEPDFINSPPSSAEVKNEQGLYLLSPHAPPWRVAGSLYLCLTRPYDLYAYSVLGGDHVQSRAGICYLHASFDAATRKIQLNSSKSKFKKTKHRKVTEKLQDTRRKTERKKRVSCTPWLNSPCPSPLNPTYISGINLFLCWNNLHQNPSTFIPILSYKQRNKEPCASHHEHVRDFR
jgi:hypothetical protein